MCSPENEELFNTAVKEYGHLGWSKVRDRLVCRFYGSSIFAF